MSDDDFYRGVMWTRALTDLMLKHADKIADSDDVRFGYRLAIREMRLAIDSELEDLATQEHDNDRAISKDSTA